jgi:hypothetical protein
MAAETAPARPPSEEIPMPARITAFLLAAAMAATAATPSAGQSDARIKAQIARIAPGMDTSHLTAADYGAIRAILSRGDESRGRREREVRAYIRANAAR